MNWTEIKDGIEAATGLGRDALHIYGALLIQIAAAVLLRRSLAHWLPWLIVLGFVAANEYLDGYSDGTLEQWETSAGLHDLWNTMIVPTTLLLLARFAPRLVVPSWTGRGRGEGALAKTEAEQDDHHSID